MSKNPAPTRVRIALRGRVQGVGFRYFTRGAARKLGLAGWVRNEPDGSVTCEAQGEPTSIEEFTAMVRRGPRFSRVDDLSVEPLSVEEASESGFAIH